MRGLISRLLRAISQTHLEGKRCHWAMVDLVRRLGTVATLLDVGCLSGEKTLDFARALSVPPEGIYGIEVHEPSLASARKVLQVHKVDLESKRIPLPDVSLDLVICNQVLEHLKDPFHPLTEFERIIKPGGHLAVGVPNLASLANRFHLLVGLEPMCLAFPGPHVRGYTYRSLLRFLKSNPAFRFVASSGSSLYPFPRPILESGARLLPGLASYVFYLLKKTEHRKTSAWQVGSQYAMTTFDSHG